jgi:ribosomal protein S26
MEKEYCVGCAIILGVDQVRKGMVGTKEERGGFIDDGYWCWWTWDEERTRN